MNLDAFDTFHKSRLGHLVFGLVELALSYVVLLRAVDTGNLIIWTVVIILLVAAVHNFINVVWIPRNDHKN